MGIGGWTRRRQTLVTWAGLGFGLAVILVTAYAGPLVAVLAAAGLFLTGRTFYPRVRRSLAAEEERLRSLRERAEQQHDWAARGDMRGVYGPEGAELMQEVAPPAPAPVIPPGEHLEVATVVKTPAELAALIDKKLPCWRYAAFVSILVQRRAEVRGRIRDALTGFPSGVGEVADTEFEAARFFADRFSDLSELMGRIDTFMLSPAFQGVFGDREESADADGIVHMAGRLMDYHDQSLVLNERCRGVQVPRSCADLRTDMSLLTASPVEAFDTFIDTFTDRVAEMADVARYATGDVQLDAVTLSVSDNDALIARISRRIIQIARST